MKIFILDGTDNRSDSNMSAYLKSLKAKLESLGHVVVWMRLKDMDIKYCTGCWSCWVKTAGECVFKDDSHEVCRQSINSDLVIMASPVVMGFPTALLKKAQDKMIPLVHPYMEIDQGEIHHIKRYERYPYIALILEKLKDTDNKDIALIDKMYQRFALNMKSKLVFTKLISNGLEEVVNEIDAI